ncbi:MAG: VWA domain-containing protein [Polyangiaceae bacterium]
MSLDLARPASTGRRGGIASSSFGLLTLVPPARDAQTPSVARDLIVLLDTSGSMGGAPLAQAQRVVSAMIDTLSDRDQIELIEFSTSARRWKNKPVSATSANKAEVLRWLNGLRAAGSTEMRDGILAAMNGLRAESQRQVVLITDGMIGFETEVVKAIIERLPRGSRVHTVGVGSAVNRSLTGPAARAGHGIEVIIGLGEDAERAARRIVTRTDAPLVVDLELSGDALEEQAPRSLPDLFAGSPALVSVKLKAAGGSLFVRGRTATGTWEQRVAVRAIENGAGNAGLAALFAREKVEDLETEIASGKGTHQVDPEIENVGLAYQIATRLTSWIAVSRDVMVDPRDALRRERMPHELAHGLSAEGIGLRSVASGSPITGAPPPATLFAAPVMMQPMPAPMAPPAFGPPPAPPPAPAAFGGMAPPPAGAPRRAQSAKISSDSRLKKAEEAPAPAFAPSPPAQSYEFDDIESDGVMSGLGAGPAREEPPLEPEKPSLISRVKRFFGFSSEPTTEESTTSTSTFDGPAELAKEERPRPEPTSAIRTIEARLVKRTASEMLIELTCEQTDLVWASGLTVEVTWDDGSTSSLRVDEARTTRATTLKPGQSARLTIQLGQNEQGKAPREIRVLHGADQLILRLA